MQKKVQIVSDGSLDLSQEITKEHDIEDISEGNGGIRSQRFL